MKRLFATLLASLAFGQTPDVPRTVRQGSALHVRASAGAASARMNGRTIRLFPQTDGSAFGLMPTPVIEKPGAYTLELLDAAGAVIATFPVTVVDARFRRQNVTVSASVAELKPSPGETEAAAAFRNTVSEVRHWSEPLALPIPGCMTSPFGVLRYLNGKPTGNFHGGIDQRGPAGTPIRAAAAGVVKIARDWNIHGRTVGVDHGQGLASMYMHMSRIAVAEGATVKTGDVLGYVGSTGRSTAPHLHWSLYANGLPVNPRDWVKVAPCPPRK
jgi:murein DD-endopeptidase MepM/ murein hydrolase activator NlpD